MIYGLVIGLISLASFIQTNNSLFKKYYYKPEKSIKRKISSSSKLVFKKNEIYHWFYPPNIAKYSKLQKQHYIWSMIILILFTALSVELIINGYTKLYFNIPHNLKEIGYISIDIGICFFINGIYYFYHWLAHTRFLYKHIHCYHHAFLSPEPFDSLVGHPLDHLISAINLVIPMFIYPMHIVSFMIYSSVISTIGIYDHCGIKIQFLNYDSIDHHIHHKYPLTNYGTPPFMIWDKFFGTYRAHL